MYNFIIFLKFLNYKNLEGVEKRILYKNKTFPLHAQGKVLGCLHLAAELVKAAYSAMLHPSTSFDRLRMQAQDAGAVLKL